MPLVALVACAALTAPFPFVGQDKVAVLEENATNVTLTDTQTAPANETTAIPSDTSTPAQSPVATNETQAQPAAGVRPSNMTDAAPQDSAAPVQAPVQSDGSAPPGAMMLMQSNAPLRPKPSAAKPFFTPIFQDFTQASSPPDILAVSEIVARDLVMMGFWYRMKYGFKIFAELNNVEERWVTASSSYFDMLANGYIMHAQTTLLYVGMMQAMSFKANDPKTWGDAQVGRLTMRQAHFFYLWLFWQNTLDITLIHQAHGNEVDPKYLSMLSNLVVVSGWWAFMHWDITASFALLQLHLDGQPWDASKLHAALSYVFQKQFVWVVKSMLWGGMSWIPDELPFKTQLQKSTNFHGFGLAGLSAAIVYHMHMAVHVPIASKKRYVGVAQLSAVALPAKK